MDKPKTAKTADKAGAAVDTKIQDAPIPETPFTGELELDDEDLALAPQHVSNLYSMIKSAAKTAAPIKSISLKKQLTKQLVAMAHLKELLLECTSEMYVIDLPSSGRTEKAGPARVIDGIDLETGQEVVLVLNVMMVSAFERSGYSIVRAIERGPDGKVEPVSSAGFEMKGRAFAFRAGQIKADKGYRVVDVCEVDVER